MAIQLIIFAAAAAGLQAPPAAAPAHHDSSFEHPGRAFLSPMGEPVFGRTPGEDGLVAWFQQVDRNHDGVITVDEMVADADHFFDTLDTNHDGEIDPDEIAHYESVIAPEVRSRWIASGPFADAASDQQSSNGARSRGGNGPDGGRGGSRGGHRGGSRNVDYGGLGGDDEAAAGRFGLLEIPEPVASADSDFDRSVSREEFRSAATARFKLLDIDHSGRLTLPELERIREAAEADARHPDRPQRDDSEASPHD